MPKRGLSLPLRAVAITAALLAVLAATAAASSLSGSIGGGATFPTRTLVLSAPPGVPVSVPSVYVRENGKPVDHLSVTPMGAVNRSDFGIVLVIDHSESMSGAPLARAMAAARAIAAQRSGRQKLGVITFDGAPSVALPMTSAPRSIDRVLTGTPWTGVGSSPLPAVMAALKRLAYAHIANGAVILLSDGAAGSSGKLTAQAVGTAAQAQHVHIFTVGLKDRAYGSGALRRLAQLGGGKFVTAARRPLPRVFTHLLSTASRSYLLSYQSILPGSQAVAVTVHVNGVAALLRLRYNAPAPASGTTSSGGSSSGATSSGTAASGASPSAPKSSRAKSGATKSNGPKSTGAKSTSTTPSNTGLAGTLKATPGAVLALLAHQPAAPQAAGSGHTTKAPPVSRRVGAKPPSTVTAAPAWVPPAPRHSFWSSSLAVVAIAGSCALLIALALGVLLYRRPSRRALQQRVGTFTLASPDPTPEALTKNAGGPVASLLTRRRWWPTFAQRVDTARIPRSPLQVVKRWVLMSLVAAVILALVTGSAVFAILLLLIAPLALRTRVSRGARKSQRSFREQLPSHLQDLAGAMRGGRSFVGGISAMVESATEPIRGEFDRALSDERLGLPLEDTLEAIGRRMEAKDMEQVALIAALNRNSGSNVAEALERVAQSARERQDLQREMKALTGQARMSAYVLTGMPPALLGALTFIAPGYAHPLFHSTIGVVMLFVATGMLAAGWFVMNKIINVEV